VVAPLVEVIRPEVSPVGPGDTQAWHDVWGDVRTIRVHAQDLWGTAGSFDEAAALSDGALRAAQLKKAFDSFKLRYSHISDAINAKFATIQGLLDQYPDLDNQMSDDITRMGNAWQRVTDAWNAVDETKLEDSLGRLSDARKQLYEMVFYAGLITIPSRLKGHLSQRDTGQTLNFHEAFGDELIDDAMEKRLLRYLANVNVVPGEIDVENGTVVATAATRRGIVSAIAAIGIVSVLPFVLLIADQIIPALENELIGEGNLDDLAKTYLLVLIGAAAHFGINLIKSQRAGQTFIIGQRLRWITARLGQILLSIASLWIISFGAWKLLGEFNPATMFFVGYSWDSLFDLFLNRFTVAVNAANTGISGKLTPPPG
jgi:hypothetical protein